MRRRKRGAERRLPLGTMCGPGQRRERILGKHPQDATWAGHHFPTHHPTSSGLFHQPSPAGDTGGPEIPRGTAQVARWVLELPPGRFRAKPKHFTVLRFLSCSFLDHPHNKTITWASQGVLFSPSRRKWRLRGREVTYPRSPASCWQVLERSAAP